MALFTHGDYVASLAPEVRTRLIAIQHTLESLLPAATRCISYRIPAYRDQQVFFYFAAFKHHIGIYPPVRHDQVLIEALAAYRGEKGVMLAADATITPVSDRPVGAGLAS